MNKNSLVRSGISLATLAVFFGLEYYNIFRLEWNTYEIAATITGWAALLGYFLYSCSFFFYEPESEKKQICFRIFTSGVTLVMGTIIAVVYILYAATALLALFLVYKLIGLLSVVYHINVFAIAGCVLVGIVLIVAIALFILILKIPAARDSKLKTDKPIDPRKIPPPPVLSD